MKCGNCKQGHPTVADVKACYAGQATTTPVAATVGAASTSGPVAATSSDTFATTFGGKQAAQGPPATDKQVAFIRRLASEKVVPVAGKDQNEAWRIRIVECAQGGKAISKSEASDAISYLMDLPKQATTTTVLPDVPEGHYAIPSLTSNNDLDFFRVDRPNEGKWAGYTFLKRVVGGKPDLPVACAQRRQVLEAIVAAGVDAARQQYGVSIGRCYVCNRHLTDELSRQLGIGPDCRKKG